MRKHKAHHHGPRRDRYGRAHGAGRAPRFEQKNAAINAAFTDSQGEASDALNEQLNGVHDRLTDLISVQMHRQRQPTLRDIHDSRSELTALKVEIDDIYSALRQGGVIREVALRIQKLRGVIGDHLLMLMLMQMDLENDHRAASNTPQCNFAHDAAPLTDAGPIFHDVPDVTEDAPLN